jgi:hypothetical protein
MSTRGRMIGACVAAALLFAAGIFLLLGLPGAVIMEAAEGLWGPISTFRGDKGWPAAIYISAAMPLGIIVAAAGVSAINPHAGIAASFLWALLGYVAAGVLAAVALIAIDVRLG